MNIVRFLMDFVQCAFAVRIIVRAIKISVKIDTERHNMDKEKLSILLKREQFSIKDRLHALAFASIVFLIPQLIWTADNLSASLSFGNDVIWFLVGFVMLYTLDTEVTLLGAMWESGKETRESLGDN